MGFPWGHTYVDGDSLHDVGNVIPFLQALNERALACGYSGTLYPTTAAALQGKQVQGPSAVSDPLLTLDSFGNYMTPATISWAAIQALTAITAYKYMASSATFDADNVDTWTAFDDYTTWPPPSGFTRKRELEITSLSVAQPDGTRARFTFFQTPATIHSDLLNIDMPASVAGEAQYGTKIMLRSGGAWIVDPDQATPLPILTLPHGGLAKAGDILGPWIPNDIYKGLRSLDSIMLVARGRFHSTSSGTFDYNWPAPDPWIGYKKHVGNSGPYVSAGPPIVPYTTAGAAKTAAESNFAANLEVTTDVFDGTFGSTQGLNDFYNAVWRGTDFYGPGTGEAFDASIRAANVGLHATTGFRGFLLGSNVHTMTSAADVYMAADVTGSPFGTHVLQTYKPRPATLINPNQIYKVDTIVSNSDSRDSIIPFGDSSIQPFPPPNANAGTDPWQEWVGARLTSFLVLQRFNVAGGFQFL